MALLLVLVPKCARGYYPGTGNEIKVFPCEDHDVTDGAGSFSALPSYGNLGEGKQS